MDIRVLGIMGQTATEGMLNIPLASRITVISINITYLQPPIQLNKIIVLAGTCVYLQSYCVFFNFHKMHLP